MMLINHNRKNIYFADPSNQSHIIYFVVNILINMCKQDHFRVSNISIIELTKKYDSIHLVFFATYEWVNKLE